MIMTVTVITIAILMAVFFVGRKYWKNHQTLLSEHKKRLSEQIPQMTDAEINLRSSILFDELEENYSPEKVLEYEMLVAEYKRRRGE